MLLNDVFMIVPSSAVLSTGIWLIVSVIVFYVARTHAHKGINSISGAIHQSLRLSARTIKILRNILIVRNRDVLLAHGRESIEYKIEREFERVDEMVRKDLSEYPALHRRINEDITVIDESFSASTDVPPTPPTWVKAVESVAKISVEKGDPTVANILDDIHHSAIKSSTRALEEYRKESSKRHKILQTMMPHWRNILKKILKVEKSVNSLLSRSVMIDRLMQEYEELSKCTDTAQRILLSSSMTQFIISGFVLVIAVGAAFINFQLITLSLSEMVGSSDDLIGFKISSVAAVVIILVGIVLGIFLMESLRITRLFPPIGALSEKIRLKMVWITLAILFSLVSVEASLAYLRVTFVDNAQASLGLLNSTAQGEGTQNNVLWITVATKMGLGFIFPLVLTFVAIPLESFIHSLRTALGVVVVVILRALEWLLRLLGNMVKSSAKILIHGYDFFIFLPLGIEALIKNKDGAKKLASSMSSNLEDSV